MSFTLSRATLLAALSAESGHDRWQICSVTNLVECLSRKGMIKKQFRVSLRPYVAIILTGITVLWSVHVGRIAAAPPQQGQDISVISSPESNAVVSGSVPIIGSADHPSFQFYIVEYSPEPLSGDQWQIVGSIGDESVIDGQLAVWNTTPIPDGSYTLRLRVVRQDGNYSEAFAQQVVVTNSQPTPTDTPEVELTLTLVPEDTPIPTVTPTDLPPTPTIVIEQPVVDTPTPRPVATSPPLENPEESESFVPTVQGFSVIPLRDACLYGGVLMLSVFLLFGFLSALRLFIKGIMNKKDSG